MSTPRKDASPTSASPKSSGWAGALLGRFSSTKKRRVEEPEANGIDTDGTIGIAMADPSSRFSSSRSSPRREFTLSNGPGGTFALQSHQSPSDLMTIGPTSAPSPGLGPAVTATTTTTRSVALSSPLISRGRGLSAPSPWKTPARANTKNTVTFSLNASGVTTKSSHAANGPINGRKKTPYKRRTISKRSLAPPIRPRYGSIRPTSKILTRRMLRKPKGDLGSVDSKMLINALEDSKGLFASSASNQLVDQNNAAFRIGMGERRFGASQTGSRLAAAASSDVSVAGNLTYNHDSESQESLSHEKRKVAFVEQSNSASTMEFATPKKGFLPPKSTPYKPTPFPATDNKLQSPSGTPLSASTASSTARFNAPPPRPSFLIGGDGMPKLLDINEETLDGPSSGSIALFFPSSFNFDLRSGSERPYCPVTPIRDYSTYESLQKADDIAAEQNESEKSKEHPAKRQKSVKWKCRKEGCGTMNDDDESRCVKCGTGRSSSSTILGWGDMFKTQFSGKWKCPACSSHNDKGEEVCLSCGAPNPGAPDVSGTTMSSSLNSDKKNNGAISASGFNFIASSDNSNSGFVFGNSSKSATPSSTSTSGFVFKSSSTPAPISSPPTKQKNDETPKQSGFSFGSTTFGRPSTEESKSQGQPKASKVQFGSVTPEPPSSKTSSSLPGDRGAFTEPSSKRENSNGPVGLTSVSKVSFPSPTSFGNSKDASSMEKAKTVIPTEKSKTKPTSAPTFQFGAPVTSTEVSADASSEPKRKKRNAFTDSDSSAPGNGASKTSMFQFGQTPQPKPQPGPSSFGSKESTSLAASSSIPTKQPFTFGSQNTSVPAADDGGSKKPTFKFGNTESIQLSAPTGDVGVSKKHDGFSFDTASKNTAPAQNAGALAFFGSAQDEQPKNSNSSSTPAKSTAFGSAPAPMFGAAITNSNQGANNGTAQFGGLAETKAPAPSAPAFVFGSAPTPAAPITPAPAPVATFGSTSTTPAPFGTTPAPATASFQFGSTPAPATPAPFGSTPGLGAATPAFGASASSTTAPAFGASTPAPAFGASMSTPAPAFGKSSLAPAPAPFGGSTALNPFGAVQAAQTPGFGTAPASFGSPPLSSAGGFFGAPTGGNNNMSSGGGLSFGNTPVTPAPSGTGGFPVAPHTAPSGFGGSANGMGAPQFSIGSSGPSTKTPGRRRVIRAKRPSTTSRPA